MHIQRHMAFHHLLSQCRHSRRNLSVDRNISNSDLHRWSNQRPGFTSVPIEKTFSLECGDVLHHRRLTGEAEMVLNFPSARSDALFALLALNEIKPAFLPIREHIGQSLKTREKASSNEHAPLCAVIASESKESYAAC